MLRPYSRPRSASPAACRQRRGFWVSVAASFIGFASATAFAGVMSLAWNPPSTNTDGSPLNDLTAYKVYSGCSQPGVYSSGISVLPSPSYVLSGLPDTGTCYAAVTALNSAGVESARSNEVSKSFSGGGGVAAPGDPTLPPTVTWARAPKVTMTLAYAGTNASNGSSTTLTLTGINTTGYTHAVIHAKHEGASTTFAATDNTVGAVAYTAETAVHHANSDLHSDMLWGKIGTPGASTTFTVTFGAARTFRIMHVWLVNATGGALEKDAAAQTSGSGTAMDAGTLSTTGVNVVSFMGVGQYNNGTTTPSSGWTEDYDSNSLGVQGWGAHRGPETTTPINPAATWATNDDWTANALSLREPAAGGAMVGSATVTFTASATGAGAGAMVGPTTLTFTPAGTLTGAGAMVGPATITFTPTGTLVGAGAMVGPATITFTPTATAQGAGALVGATTLTFTGTGTLAGVGAMAATSTLTFTATGTMQLPSGALAGSATLTFTPTGALTGSGAMVGATTLTFTPTGTLGGPGDMTAAATLTFTPTGVMRGDGALAGNVPFTFTPAGTMRGAGALGGVATLSFTLNGVLVDGNAPVVEINPVTGVAFIDVDTGVQGIAVTASRDPLSADRRVIH